MKRKDNATPVALNKTFRQCLETANHQCVNASRKKKLGQANDKVNNVQNHCASSWIGKQLNRFCIFPSHGGFFSFSVSVRDYCISHTELVQVRTCANTVVSSI